MSRPESPGARAGRRVSYAEAGRAHRDAVWRAHSIGLPLVQERVLVAVMALTVSYSKLSDTTYLAHLAQWAYGVEQATDKQVKRTGEILKALADHGLIQRRPPGKGRPGASTAGPTYFVALIPPGENTPDLGPFPAHENTPDLGPEVPPDSGRKYPQSGAENTPSLGPPPSSTEKVTEESTEKNIHNGHLSSEHVVKEPPEDLTDSSQPSTEDQGQGRHPQKGQGQSQGQGQERTTGENLADVEDDVDGQAPGGQWDEHLTPEDDIEIPEDLRADWTSADTWCALRGCPVETPDKSRFCADHTEDVGGSEESAPTSKVSDNDLPVDGPEETPSSLPQSDQAVDGRT